MTNIVNCAALLAIVAALCFACYRWGRGDERSAKDEAICDKRLDLLDLATVRWSVAGVEREVRALGRALGWEYLEAQHHVPGGRRIAGWYPIKKEGKCAGANAPTAAVPSASTGDVLTVLHTSSPLTSSLPLVGGFSQFGATVSLERSTPAPKRKRARGSSTARGRK